MIVLFAAPFLWLLFAALTRADFLRADVHGQDVRPLRESGGQLRQKSRGLRDRHVHAAGALTPDAFAARSIN